MSITQDEYDFEQVLHQPIQVGAQETPIVRGQFFGIYGESHIAGQPSGRDLSCDAILEGYDTEAALSDAYNAIADKSGLLTGDLDCTIASQSNVYPSCTFVGIRERGQRFKDGVSGGKWVQFVTLMWRQRKVT